MRFTKEEIKNSMWLYAVTDRAWLKEGEDLVSVCKSVLEKAGADYIGVGAVFGTSTKKNARYLTVEKLKEISESVSIPVVAIGGISASNIMELKNSGVDGVAVVSAIFAAENPGEATADLLRLSKEMVYHG